MRREPSALTWLACVLGLSSKVVANVVSNLASTGSQSCRATPSTACRGWWEPCCPNSRGRARACIFRGLQSASTPSRSPVCLVCLVPVNIFRLSLLSCFFLFFFFFNFGVFLTDNYKIPPVYSTRQQLQGTAHAMRTKIKKGAVLVFGPLSRMRMSN